MEQSKSQVNNDVLYPRVKGDSGCPLNITGGTQNQEAMTKGHRSGGRGGSRVPGAQNRGERTR